MIEAPSILAETGDYAVICKPPRMHCAPQKKTKEETLLDWYAARFPPVRNLAGRKAGEGGIVHRLDFETQGLVLFAKNRKALDFFQARQEAGAFIKEYSAVCARALPVKEGFPPPPETGGIEQNLPLVIGSFFRPFGPGRKEVRPVTRENRHWETAKDRGQPYITAITAFSRAGPHQSAFTLRITRGFRHQIRCHLAWIGHPILNDPLYGAAAAQEQTPSAVFLALRCHALFFNDPENGEGGEYRIPPLTESADSLEKH